MTFCLSMESTRLGFHLNNNAVYNSSAKNQIGYNSTYENQMNRRSRAPLDRLPLQDLKFIEYDFT